MPSAPLPALILAVFLAADAGAAEIDGARADAVPAAVAAAVERAKAVYEEAVLRELEPAAEGGFVAEFTGPDGEGQILLSREGRILHAIGICEPLPVVPWTAVPPPVQRTIVRLRLAVPPALERGDLGTRTVYHLRTSQDGVRLHLVVAADGAVVRLRTRKGA